MNVNEWIGNTFDISDSMAPEQFQKFEALMNGGPDSVGEGLEIPPCGHWIYFNPPIPQADLGINGHERNSDFLPPIDLPRRMWAGGTLKFKKPLKTGIPADKKSTITKIEEKDGKTGRLCFVTIRHQVSSSGAVAIDEEQTLVYREDSEKGAHPIRTKPLDIDPDWRKSTKPDSVQLFRYSALTFNSHRIHYDQDYAREMEGYPNVIVHAPFLVLLMLDAFKSKADGKVISKIQYENLGPVYLGEQITICGKSVDNTKSSLRIHGPEGKLAMKAEIDWGYDW
ncbi:FAS1-like dehydratase domain-containing protein [Rhodohalobacter barkolensis]|uniref:Acyl-CoA dehydrogenase n=1 Tax=Rhodohalobacter barkolensis TaxID=2053187 RepID=A0A2N0VGM0_9BACT|nr:MaoC family dehydratase N-terminal domain-containing protein [Rhodohalobacter barkolensis]PKD43327.1 acyl-CoA dehydrogenase [Rhodohalobacter barkolensis]